jgi:hypothetical protein
MNEQVARMSEAECGCRVEEAAPDFESLIRATCSFVRFILPPAKNQGLTKNRIAAWWCVRPSLRAWSQPTDIGARHESGGRFNQARTTRMGRDATEPTSKTQRKMSASQHNPSKAPTPSWGPLFHSGDRLLSTWSELAASNRAFPWFWFPAAFCLPRGGRT